MGAVVVNVLDFGARPGADCSDAFQRAVDSLDPQVGGTVFVPGADQAYRFSRSVLVDRSSVRIVGENPTTSQLSSTTGTPPLVFGMVRAPHGVPLSDGHWVDLHGIVDTTAASAPGQRWGYRTGVPSNDAILTFPCSPFAFGPKDRTFWAGTRQLTVDFLVQNNAMPWAQQQLFGTADAFGNPAPFFVKVDGAAVVFAFRTADSLYREIRLPFDASNPVLRCSLQLDLDAGTVAGWINHIQVQPDLTWINDGWQAGVPAFVPNWYSPFTMGALGARVRGWGGGGDLQVGAVDLTFGALRYSNVAQYQNLGVGSAQPVTDLDWLSLRPGVFGVLPMDEQPHKSAAGLPDLQVPWQTVTGQRGYGMFVPVTLDESDTVSKNAVEKLTVACFPESTEPGKDFYGQVIGLGYVYDFMMDDVIVLYGAQGLSAYNVGSNYPVELRSCEFSWQTDAAIYSYYQIGRGDNLRLKYYGRSAMKALLSDLSYRNVFCTDSDKCESVVRLFQSGGTFDNWTIDFEGGPRPADSYFWASLGDFIGGPTQLTIRDCHGGSGSDHAAAIRLVSTERNAGLPDAARGPGWCKIERSFNRFLGANLQALVAVDGPIWQGIYEGVPPKSPPLVVNTMTPGGSARIGVGSVPPAVSLPPISVAGTADPVLGLPGLIGYYRADPLRKKYGDSLVPLTDGDPIDQLTDLSPAGNHGTPVNGSAVFEAASVNGHAAMRFTGGWYQFPAMRGSTGAATMFFVGRRLPIFDTNPAQLQSLRTLGAAWQLTNSLYAHSAESDTDWAVYAVRYSAGPARILRTWANGHPCDLRRRDDAGRVEWSTPTLGTINHGYTQFRGLMSTAIICDAEVSDQLVAQISQHLVNLHQVAV